MAHPQHRLMLMQVASDILNTEAKLYDKYRIINHDFKFFSNIHVPHQALDNDVVHYLRHQEHHATMEPIPVALASLIPCFYLYNVLGQYMQQKKIAPDNPYRLWIESYSSPTFQTSTQYMIDVFNDVGTPEIKALYFNRIMKAWVQSIEFEIALWDGSCHAKSLQCSIFH